MTLKKQKGCEIVTRTIEAEVTSVFRKHLEKAVQEVADKYSDSLSHFWPEDCAERLAVMATCAVGMMDESAKGQGETL